MLELLTPIINSELLITDFDIKVVMNKPRADQIINFKSNRFYLLKRETLVNEYRESELSKTIKIKRVTRIKF